MDAKELNEIRWSDPARVVRALRERRHAARPEGRLLIIACDHPARGALAVGSNPTAMSDRWDLLRRLATALSRPGVHGFLGTADIVEDLALMGALDGKIVFGSMNRGGLAGSAFEMDDRLTGYDTAGVLASNLDGGKLLLRIDVDDPGTVATLETAGRTVSELAGNGLIAMVEPFISRRVAGSARNDLTPDAVARSVAISAGLGRTSAYTWLKVPAVDDMATVAAATTLPLLVLGGEVSNDNEGRWQRALECDNVRGLVIGRSLLYPADDDIAKAVDRAAALTNQ